MPGVSCTVVATVGTELHPVNGESFKIKKGKIRGEVSMGMICAEDEIGVGQSHEGIIELDPTWTPVRLSQPFTTSNQMRCWKSD